MLTLSNCSNVQARHEVHEHCNEIISHIKCTTGTMRQHSQNAIVNGMGYLSHNAVRGQIDFTIKCTQLFFLILPSDAV